MTAVVEPFPLKGLTVKRQKGSDRRVAETFMTGSQAVRLDLQETTVFDEDSDGRALGLSATVFAQDWESEADSVFDSLLENAGDVPQG